MGNDVQSASHERLLTPREVARLLRVSLTTVYRLVDARSLPFLKLGGVLRFETGDVEEFIRRGRVAAAHEHLEYGSTQDPKRLVRRRSA